MNDIILGVLLGIVLVALLGVAIYFIVKFCKMTPDQKKKTLITYLKGLVAMAETELGAGHGDEKLALVEDYFKKNAPWLLKILLKATGKQNLKELIELALTEVKDSFGNKCE